MHHKKYLKEKPTRDVTVLVGSTKSYFTFPHFHSFLLFFCFNFFYHRNKMFKPKSDSYNKMMDLVNKKDTNIEEKKVKKDDTLPVYVHHSFSVYLLLS